MTHLCENPIFLFLPKVCFVDFAFASWRAFNKQRMSSLVLNRAKLVYIKKRDHSKLGV